MLVEHKALPITDEKGGNPIAILRDIGHGDKPLIKEMEKKQKIVDAVEERRAIGAVDVEIAQQIANVQLNAAKQLIAAQNDGVLALMDKLIEMKKLGIEVPTPTVTALLTQAIPGAANKPEDPNVIDVEFTPKSTAATATGDLYSL